MKKPLFLILTFCLYIISQKSYAQKSIFVETHETHESKELSIKYLEPLIRNDLAKRNYTIAKDKAEADIHLLVKADSRKSSEYDGIFTSFVDASISIINIESGNEVFQNAYFNVKGSGLDYKQAALNAYKKVGKNLIADINDRFSQKISETTQQKQITNDFVINEVDDFENIVDIDVDIPISSVRYSNRYALIFGNEDYTKYQPDLKSESNVDFARNDAKIFAEYCNKTLGIPEENITVVTDAISSQMKREILRFINKAKYGEGNVELIFYYSGHGFPDNFTKESYIMPVDISGANVTDGIKLSQLYSDLTEFPSKKVSVFIDACFSGGGRNQGLLTAKAVKIAPKKEDISGNLVVFSASSEDQESLFYKEKKHGMFTYFLLKKLQETKGEVSYGELSDYIKRMVPLTATDILYKDQNPEINTSPEVRDTWKNWKLK